MIKMPRTLNLPQAALTGLPPVHEYECLRTTETITIDGKLDEAVWQRATWSAPFIKIDTGAPVLLDSRVALLWDDDYLYVGFKYEDHEIWGTHVEHHDHVYHNDSDAEIFILGAGVYYELGINPINTIYEVFWSWVEPLVVSQNITRLNQLFSTENYLYFLPRVGERMGRFGELDWELPGIKHAVHVDGTLNCPAIRDNGWTVEFALPWVGLSALGQASTPPCPGDIWQIGASRCQHFRDAQGTHTSVDWSWNQHGYINMHIPERWSNVRFRDQVA